MTDKGASFRGFYFICFLLPLLISAQENVNKNGFRLQAGISALPIFDAFKQQPQNELGGIAMVGNFGAFVLPRLSFGVNPFYAKIINTYATAGSTTHNERQQLTNFGLNTYLRGYLSVRSRLSVYALVSAGFGVMRDVTSPLNPGIQTGLTKIQMRPVATMFAGPGVSWNFTSSIAVEANIPLAILYFMEDAEKSLALTTVLPTFGIQFRW